MKILFYIEPHPIRESHTQYTWVAKLILEMIFDEFVVKKNISNSSIRIIVTKKLYDELKKYFPDNENIEKYIMVFSHKVNEEIDSYYKSWDEDNISIWKDLMSGQGNISKFYENVIKDIYLTRYDFDRIVYWGTNGAVRNFSNVFNIPAIAMELGCTRAPILDSVYFDFLGVNGAAYTNQIDLNKVESKYTHEEIINFLPIKLYAGQNFSGMFNPINNKNIYNDLEKNIIIPLQLADDANIIMYSKYNNMHEFLNEIIPSLTQKGYICFVKPHPGAKYRKYNSLDHKKCKEYCDNIDNVYWLDDIKNNSEYISLLVKMRAIVCINSSMGFEALLLNKLVIAQGKSPYNIQNSLPNFEEFIHDRIDMTNYKIKSNKIANLLLFNYLHFKDKSFTFSYFLESIKFNSELFYLYKMNKESFNKHVISYKHNDIDDFFDGEFIITNGNKSKVKTVEKIICYCNLKHEIKQLIKRIPLIGSVLLKIKHKMESNNAK